jgi:hypothetical protein
MSSPQEINAQNALYRRLHPDVLTYLHGLYHQALEEAPHDTTRRLHIAANLWRLLPAELWEQFVQTHPELRAERTTIEQSDGDDEL